MDRILYNQNAAQAASFIESLETQFAPTVNSLVDLIVALGITEPTDQMISGAIVGDFTAIDDAYVLLTASIVDALATPEEKAAMTKSMGASFEHFKIDSRALFAGTVGNTNDSVCPVDHIRLEPYQRLNDLLIAEGKWGLLNANSQDLFQFVSLDGVTSQYIISDPQKAAIGELFCEYVEDAKEILAHQTQQVAAEAIQNFANALEDLGVDTSLKFSPIDFFHRYFKIETAEPGVYAVTQRKLSRLIV